MTRVRYFRPVHLTQRFVGSLRPRPLEAADRELVRSVLQPGELECWERLGPADRAESVATARALGAQAAPTWIAAALLHDVGKADVGKADVGKAESSFGPLRRALATAVTAVAGPNRVRSWRNAVGRYANHDELGSARLREAGARPEAVAWAAAHHRRDLWPATGIAPEVCEQLAAADGEPGPE